MDTQALIEQAREACSKLRDFARANGMHFRERDPLVAAIHAGLDAALSRDEARVDGSVLVRVDPVYAEKMRGDGLIGPFSRIRLVEDGPEPRLELAIDPTPTPDTVEWWRAVAQDLANEIHKLRGLARIEGEPK